MNTQSKWRNHFQEHKILFTALAVGLFLVELEIFAVAAARSGPESRIQVMDHQGNLVYEVRSSRLAPRDKAYFENTYGPLSNYQVRLVTMQRPFPFRAWLAAAVGFPIGSVLLFVFFIRSYESLFFRNKQEPDTISQSRNPPQSKLDSILARINRINIFAIGFLVLLFAVGLFAVPRILAEFGSYSAAAISKYRWIVLAAVAVFLALVVWVIFLRYRLARKAIETRAEVEKYRLQLKFFGNHTAPAQIKASDREYPLAYPMLEDPAAPHDAPHDAIDETNQKQ